MNIFFMILSIAHADDKLKNTETTQSSETTQNSETTPKNNIAKNTENAPVYNNPIRPLRPTTHPGDPNLTQGDLENFRRLYLEEASILNMFDAKKNIKTSLPIINKTTGWVDVEYKGKKFARLQPLTTAVIHGVPEGQYEIVIHVEHMQYSYPETFQSIVISDSMTPGSMDAVRAESPDYIKPGFDDIPKKKSGTLVRYSMRDF